MRRRTLGLNRLPWQGQIASCLALAVAGAFAFYLNWVVPVNAEMDRQQQGLVALRVELAEALQTSSRLREADAEVKKLDERLDRVPAALPDEHPSGLFRRLQTLAAQSSLSIRGFTPQTVEERDRYSARPIRPCSSTRPARRRV